MNIADDFLAPVHAEIDVKVRHADPLGVQEPFEEQGIAQRIKIGDRKRIGHKRTRARATPRAHRNIMILCPFNKISDDQKIARKTHSLNDAQFEIEPLLIVVHTGRVGDHLEPILQTGIGLTTQLFDLVIRKPRQDWIAPVRHKSTTARNLDRILRGFGQIGEQGQHFCCAFERVLIR